MNHQSSRAPGVRVVLARLGRAAIAASMAIAGAAQAQVIEWHPRVGADWENDSNIYYAPDAAQAAPGSRPRVSGHIYTWLAGLDLKHQGEFGSTYFTSEARRYAYSAGVGQLNRNEYNGALGHTIGREAGNHFSFEVGGSRKLAPFLALDNTTTFATESQRYGRITGSLALGGAQTLDMAVERRISETPLPGAAGYGTNENAYRLGYGRSGTRFLSYGVRVELDDGRYTGVNGGGDYRRAVPEAYVRYAVPAVVSLDASLGGTRRSQAGAATISATTGTFALHYELGVKTTLELGAVRRIVPYYASEGSQLDTTYSAGLSWRPTSRLSFAINGYRTRSNVTLVGSAGSRIDNADSGTATVNFVPNRWLTLSAYGRKQSRSSTISTFNFDNSTVGATFRIQKP